jgi:branched-chain amino acid aminotransferase
MYFTDHSIVYSNGEWLEADSAKTDLYGQTLHYGCGVFEGIRAYPTALGTQIFKANKHYERLLHSCERMGINIEYSADELVAISYELLDKNNLNNAYIRPLVYMDANMALQVAKKSNVFICCWDWAPYLGEKLLRVMVSSFERPNPRSCFVDAKITGHYANAILAVNEAKSKGYDEALLLDLNGFVAEGPGANFFYEKDGVIYTSPQGHILPGITRSTVIKLAKELEIPVKEKFFNIKDVLGADGAFFTGTAAEVAGLRSLNDVDFAKPFSETHGYTLKNAYKSLVKSVEAHIIDVV